MRRHDRWRAWWLICVAAAGGGAWVVARLDRSRVAPSTRFFHEELGRSWQLPLAAMTARRGTALACGRA